MRDEDFKQKINEGLPQRSAQSRQRSVTAIVQGARRQQGQKDVLDFGLIKFWTILLQIFSMFYVETKRHQNRVPIAESNS